MSRLLCAVLSGERNQEQVTHHVRLVTNEKQGQVMCEVCHASLTVLCNLSSLALTVDALIFVTKKAVKWQREVK